MSTSVCAEMTMLYPALLFVLGSLSMTPYVKIREKLTIMQTLSALVGLRRVEWNFLMIVWWAVSIFAPLLWILFVIIFHERIQAFIFPNQQDDEAD